MAIFLTLSRHYDYIFAAAAVVADLLFTIGYYYPSVVYSSSTDTKARPSDMNQA